MSFNRLHFPIYLALVAFLWLSACGAEKTSKTEIGTVQPTVETVITPTFPTPTTLPTATATTQVTLPNIGGTLITTAQENHLVDALQLEDCELPCYLGITPGKTSWASAQQILADLGAEFEGEYYESGTGLPGYGYEILIENSANNPISPLDISQYLNFLVKDSIVQRIVASAESLTQELKFRNYWSRYSPQQVFIRLGKPDMIYYSSQEGNGMILVYESLEVVIMFSGMREGNSVCPNFELDGHARREFILTNKTSGLSLVPEKKRIPLTDRERWLPVDKLLGVSREDFFNQVVANPSVCFEMKTLAP